MIFQIRGNIYIKKMIFQIKGNIIFFTNVTINFFKLISYVEINDVECFFEP